MYFTYKKGPNKSKFDMGRSGLYSWNSATQAKTVD